jgi:hypothetical protein
LDSLRMPVPFVNPELFENTGVAHPSSIPSLDVQSAARAGWRPLVVEHLTGSIRRACLDHVIVFNEASLPGALSSYLQKSEPWIDTQWPLGSWLVSRSPTMARVRTAIRVHRGYPSAVEISENDS